MPGAVLARACPSKAPCKLGRTSQRLENSNGDFMTTECNGGGGEAVSASAPSKWQCN